KTYLNRDNRIGEHAFTFKVRFGEGPGPYRMEVLAHKTTAIQSAARFTVYYGRKRPPEEKEPPIPKGRKTPRDIHTLLVEKRFLARLNEFRRSVKLDPVGWNEAVAARAREHAVRMAKARRRQHRFGNVGVREMLGRDGAGPGGASGPDRAWTRLTGVRPFDRPAPQPPGPRVRNHVVVFILALDSLEEMFERYFVREAAFRLCALDPYCIEVAVGAARSPRKPAPKPPPGIVRTYGRLPERLVYCCVCFVQINDKTIIAAQDGAYAALLEKAAARDPQDLRRLGIWGRGGVKARTLVERALGDERSGVFAAAFDALLLLDERRARADLDRIAVRKEATLERGRYAEAVALFLPFRGVLYDGKITGAYERVAKAAQRAARDELRQIKRLEEPQRTARLESLRRRVEGLAVAAEVERALAESR
ncbi:MAG: CAP domain-containing protein, partial [Planctomycetota bacterium]